MKIHPGLVARLWSMIFKKFRFILLSLALLSCSDSSGAADLSADRVEQYISSLEGTDSFEHLAKSLVPFDHRWSSNSSRLVVYAVVENFTSIEAAQTYISGTGLLSYSRSKCTRKVMQRVELELHGTQAGYFDAVSDGKPIFVVYVLFDQLPVDAYLRVNCN